MNDALKRVVKSDQLTAYTLSKDVLAKLKKFDDMHGYCVLANRPVPDAVRLFRHDYNTVNNAVLRQSEHVFSAATVFYRGVPVIAHDEMVNPFALEAA